MKGIKVYVAKVNGQLLRKHHEIINSFEKD